MNRDMYFQLLTHVMPIAITILPMSICHRVNGVLGAIYCLLHLGFCFLYMYGDYVALINNIVVVTICYLHNVKSKVAMDYLLTYVALFVQVGTVVATDGVVINLIVGLFVLIVLVAHIWNIVQSKDASSKVFIIFYVMQVLASLDLLNKMIEGMFYDVAGLKIVRTVLMAALPYGKYSTFLGNMVTECRAMSDLVITRYAVGTMFGSMFMYGTIFAAFRVMVGFLAMKHVHFEVSLANAGWSLYFYMVDIFCPINYAFGLLVGTEKHFGKRGWYCLLVGAMTVFELFNASEFVLARGLLYLLDTFVFKTGNGHISRMLDFDVQDTPWCFPVKGSTSFCSLEQMTNISKYVVSVLSETARGAQSCAKRGVGLIISDSRGMNALYSVKHVLDDATLVTLGLSNGKTYEFDPSTRKMLSYGGVDPVVSISLDGASKGVMGLSHLSHNECKSVSALVMVTGEDAIGFIPDFEFSQYDLYCCVDLMAGDSGSPIIAIMNSGEFRYVGAVSRGTFGSGTKNLVSIVTNGVHTGSPGSLNAYIDVTTVVDKTKGKALEKLAKMMFENAIHVRAANELEELQAAEADKEESESQSLVETRKKRQDDEGGSDDDADSDAQGKRREKTKKRNKSSRKNAAMKKRLAEFEVLTSVAFDGTDTLLSSELLAKFKKGDIVDFNKDRRYHNVFEQTKPNFQGKEKMFVKAGLGFSGT